MLNQYKYQLVICHFQVEQFTIQAVDLGELEKVKVTKQAGKAWYLTEVKVRPGQYNARETLYSYNR